jgi:hypothetical protein
MEAVAAAGYGAVGTYMLVKTQSGEWNVPSGYTISGSNLTTEANGTWRNMGRATSLLTSYAGQDGIYNEVTTALVLRIS